MDDTGRYGVTLTGGDLVAIVQALKLYREDLIAGMNDGDPEGTVLDVEHVTELVERLEVVLHGD